MGTDGMPLSQEHSIAEPTWYNVTGRLGAELYDVSDHVTGRGSQCMISWRNEGKKI